MFRQRPEDPETNADLFDLFDRWLLDAPESELQELIDNSPHWFSTQPLEVLREYKARVDARLAAEPDKKVFSMSDPHEVRLLYWDKIADRLEAEINYRSLRSVASTSGGNAGTRVHPGAKEDPTVAARRTIVRQNPGLPDKELCQLLDHEGIRLPKDWPEAGFKTWTEAYRSRNRRIHVIFSKDRTSS